MVLLEKLCDTNMCELSGCCGCLTLRTGSIIVAVLCIIGSFFHVAGLTLSLAFPSVTNDALEKMRNLANNSHRSTGNPDLLEYV